MYGCCWRECSRGKNARGIYSVSGIGSCRVSFCACVYDVLLWSVDDSANVSSVAFCFCVLEISQELTVSSENPLTEAAGHMDE